MSRRGEQDEDPYSFGSAFSDDTADDAPPASAYSDPFSAPAPSFDGAPTTTFGASSSPALPSAAPRIDAGTVAPALGVYAPARGAPALDYVFAEDYKASRKKGPGEQLTYLTGGSYLAGLAAGGATGLAAALRESAGKSGKLRLNAALNASGKRGALFANSTGVLALLFSVSETGIYNATNDDGVLNYAAAGALAGGLFKSTRGARVAGVWALGGAAVAVGAVYASREGVYGRRMQGIL